MEGGREGTPNLSEESPEQDPGQRGMWTGFPQIRAPQASNMARKGLMRAKRGTWCHGWRPGGQADQEPPLSSFFPPSSPGIWHSREVELPASCMRGEGVLNGRKSQAPSQGGDLRVGVGMADTGKWVFALFFFPLK